MNKTSYEKEGLISLNELFEKLIVCSEKQDKEGTLRIVSSLNDEEKDYLYTWATEQGKLDKVAGIVVKAEMDKKAFDINCRFKKTLCEALVQNGYCLEGDPDVYNSDSFPFTDNKYINGEVIFDTRKVQLKARDAENRKYEKTIDYSSVGDLIESINHFRKDIEETFEKPEVVEEVVKEEPFDILNDKNFLKEIGADWVTDLIKKKADSNPKNADLDSKKPYLSQQLNEALESPLDTHHLLRKKVITREDGELFTKAVNRLLRDPSDAYNLLDDKIITKEDGELYTRALDKATEGSYSALNLLKDKVITKEDGEVFIKALNQAQVVPDYALDLLKDKVITKEDGEIFTKAVNEMLENPYYALGLLENKVITKEDGEVFIKALNNALEDADHALNLLKDKVITKEDGEVFIKALNNALGDSERVSKLLKYKYITNEDGEIFTETVNRLLELTPYVYPLLEDKIITKEDGELYIKVLNRLLEDPYYARDLLKDKIITKEDGELYTRALDKATEVSKFKDALLEKGTITQEDLNTFGDTEEAEHEISSKEPSDNQEEKSEVEEQPQGGKSASIEGGLGKKAEEDYNYNLKPIKISWDKATKDTFIDYLNRTTTVGGDHGDVSFSPSSCNFENGAIIINDGTLYSTWAAISDGEYSPEDVAEGIIQDSFYAIGVLDTLDISERDIHNLKDE